MHRKRSLSFYKRAFRFGPAAILGCSRFVTVTQATPQRVRYAVKFRYVKLTGRRFRRAPERRLMAASNNIADQIASAVQDAVNSKDFSNLQDTIERSVSQAAEGLGRGVAQAADGIGRGINQASEGFRRGQEQYAKIQERKQQQALMEARYAKAGSQRGAGVALVVAGVMVAVPLAATGLMLAAIGTSAAIPTLAIGAVAGGGLAFAGSRKLKLAGAFDRYRNAIGLRETCAIDELATGSSETPDRVRKNVRALLSRGMFKQGTLSDDGQTLCMTPDAYRHWQEEHAHQLQQRKLAQAAQAEEQARAAALTPAQQHLLERGKEFVTAIREGNQAIPGPEISATIAQIERVVRAILDTAAEHPDVIDDLDRLMDYYLPTTVKLLDAYQELDAQPVQSDSIAQSKREIEGALGTLSSALEKLLDQLFAERALDVSADISVLHAVLAQEGLTESPFDAAKPRGNGSAN